ncbi:MAG: glycosyltransferase 87 family protein [Solirubrobacteraceae bacterium]
MRQRLRENAVCASLACAGCGVMAWLGLYGFAWSDYEVETRPALEALVHGHLVSFLRLAPAYGGSLIERAPFALAPGLWGGGALAVYRMVALPGLLATAMLGVWLVARMRSQGRSTLARAVALGVCVVNPITLRALELGHPEELLGACLCVAAVLFAAGSSIDRDRSLLAGALLGLAVANKEWALLAAGPVLLALPPRRRARCLASACVIAGVVLLPLLLVSSGGFLASTRAAATPAGNAIFQPWQVWWFFGHHGALVHGLFGTPKPGYRIGPAWTGAVSHPLVLAAGVAVAAALWPRARRLALRGQDALLALALVLLLRCLLDSWDTVYYPLPFVLATLAWEVGRPTRHPPALALSASALVWVSFQWLPAHISADAQAAVFLAWSLPLAAWLSVRLFAPARETLARSSARERPPGAQETTVSALGRPVRST